MPICAQKFVPPLLLMWLPLTGHWSSCIIKFPLPFVCSSVLECAVQFRFYSLSCSINNCIFFPLPFPYSPVNVLSWVVPILLFFAANTGRCCLLEYVLLVLHVSGRGISVPMDDIIFQISCLYMVDDLMESLTLLSFQ